MINGSLWEAMNAKQQNLDAAGVNIHEFSSIVLFCFSLCLK